MFDGMNLLAMKDSFLVEHVPLYWNGTDKILEFPYSVSQSPQVCMYAYSCDIAWHSHLEARALYPSMQ